jgi:hypothetical protein
MTPPHLKKDVILYQRVRRDCQPEDSLPRVHVTLASVALLPIGTAMTLEAHRSSTDQAYRGVRRKGVAAFARQGSVQLAEERIEHRGQTRDAIDRRVLEDDATVELRRRM